MVEEIIIYILLGSVVTGVISGLITSTMIFKILSMIKPKVEISEDISKDKDKDDGRTLYRIKVINRTKADIVNIRAQLHLLKKDQVKGGEILRNKRLQLKQSDLLFIEKFDVRDKNASYAYRFITYENLEEEWDAARQFVRFRIICTHPFTGVLQFFPKITNVII
ncbi:MAG: hypothetical protein AB4352_05815 [Hormoscilla sp.]